MLCDIFLVMWLFKITLFNFAEDLMEEDFLTIDLKELFNVVKNNLVFIISLTLSFALISGFYTKLMIPKTYSAQATMIVNTRPDQNAVVTYDQINSAKQLVGTYAVILKSDTVIDKVIENLNLTSLKGWEEITAEKLAKNITVEAVDATQVIKISAITIDPDLSADIVAEIVDIAPDMIINTVKAGSVEIISSPRANYKKVAPSTSKNVLIATFLGAVISIGLTIMVYMLDNTFKSEEDILKQLQLPVLGVIPTISNKGE